MSETTHKTWLRQQIENSVKSGLMQAYETIKVDPAKFVMQLRVAYGLPIVTLHGLYSVDINHIEGVADSIIHSGMRVAAVEGAGLGLGGIITLLPDLSILAGITMRTVQKLSLVYGFEYNTDDEMAELWVAAATAAGVDISRELLEREVVSRFVPKVIQKIAVQASKEVVEKWAGRMIPLASSLIGAGLNYYFVRAWGERARVHFREKHLQRRLRIREEEQPLVLPESTKPTW
jgi:hypothetical protein